MAKKRKEIRSLYASLGESGLKVELEKTSIKKNKSSGIKVGKKRTISLFDSIKTGFPIKAIREVDSTDPKNQRKKIYVTTKVKGVTISGERTFTIETKTSFYEAKFY